MPQESAFDEQRVLHELEQLQLAIRATRVQRERVQAEFDVQLRAFDPPTLPRVVPPAQPVAVASKPAALELPTKPPSREPQASPEREPEKDVEPIAVSEPAAVDGLASTGSSFRLLAIMGGLVVVAVLAFFLLVNRSPAPAPASTEAPRQAQPVPAVPPLPEIRKPPAPPVDPHVLRIDIKTLRRVWLRVSVDGRIAIEREVAEGEQLPFGADRSIVVRTGDAGAVAVKFGDLDQGPMGRDGEVVTRTFTPPVR